VSTTPASLPDHNTGVTLDIALNLSWGVDTPCHSIDSTTPSFRAFFVSGFIAGMFA
jgi:hypothetical protein